MEAARILIKAGADCNGNLFRDGTTPLAAAIEKRHVCMVRVLVEAGAALDEAVLCDATPLMVASGMGRLEIVKLLVGAGASLNVECPLPQRGPDAVPGLAGTALMAALANDHREVVKFLVEQGAEEPQNLPVSMLTALNT